MTQGTQQMTDTPRKYGGGRARMAITGVVVLAVLAVLLTLGTWQVQRLQWKEQLLSDMAARRNAPPIGAEEIAAMLSRGEDIEYRTMSVSGTFDHADERHFFATYNGQPGFYVYTPMTLDDGAVLFVNRGFVPYDLKDPALRQQGQISGEVTVTGYARGELLEKPSAIVPDNDPAKNIFYWKDLSAMTSTTGVDADLVLPFFMDVDASQTVPGGLPQGGVTQFALTNNHLQYAVTWYGLAGALVVVVIAVGLRRRRPDDAD
jgi:surfeit locus 1 family protein